MKKVTLLGDSIRQIGYGNKTVELLKDEFEVWQPSDNCRTAQYTLRGLFDWAGAMEGTEIVHWNNGAWDLCNIFGDGTFTPIDEYVSTMLRIVRVLKSRGVKKIIFATTTPVREENIYNSNDDVRAFNAAVVPKLEAEGVIINDLYSLVNADHKKYILDDMIHLTDAAIDMCAEAVAASIRRAATEIE
ncbi:MAG: SGNH/GDSL hydrolase family protein [Clostridia bacterium]|nr:SGNH/GDSL hydrolase family protein [Clostridia bacterium]